MRRKFQGGDNAHAPARVINVAFTNFDIFIFGRIRLRGGDKMTAKTWRARIKEACEAAGTYRKCFDATIHALADILEQRDSAIKYYQTTGSQPVVQFTNKNGAVNLVKNPALAIVNDLDKLALTYWRDLGLTPAGLKKINDAAMKKSKKSGLAEVLNSLG